MRYKLGELIGAINGHAFKRDEFTGQGIPVIKIKNVVPPMINFESVDTEYIPSENLKNFKKYQVELGDVVISLTGSHVDQSGSMVGKVGRYYYDFPALLNQRVAKLYVKDNQKLDEDYFYFWISRSSVQRYLALNAGGSANQANISVQDIFMLDIEVPTIDIQKAIASQLQKLIDKINVNEKINDNLDVLLTTIFENKINSGVFNKTNLTDIATYKNGLAMQKFRPADNEQSLPVLKIKELNQGYTDDSSDRCSAEIDDSVIVNTGDIVFSWSGTLLVKNWAGETAGLNQHLFKVISNNYPEWFVYEWTKYHLRKFQSIAAGKATTMGHIKRSDLKSSEVLVPNNDELDKLNTIMKPIYDKRIEIINENQRLAKIKRILLQKYF